MMNYMDLCCDPAGPVLCSSGRFLGGNEPVFIMHMLSPITEFSSNAFWNVTRTEECLQDFAEGLPWAEADM